jgi:hypothetical protein
MMCYSAAPRELLVLCCSAPPREDSRCWAVQLLHEREAGMLFSWSKTGQPVLCCSAALRESSWFCAVQLLLGRTDGVVLSATSRECI